jgi:Ser/Thr protein kinase RdoA (MazF antagonist)
VSVTEIPDDVIADYALEGATVEPSHSLINRTFIVRRGTETLVLQRLHPVFGASVHYDIEAITSRLASLGFETPRLIATRAGALWHTSDDGGVWRAQTFVDGRVIQAIEAPEQARSAAHLVARFHAALSGFEHDFAHVRANVHDTSRHLRQLELRQASSDDHDGVSLAREILTLAEESRLDFTGLPRRICHGDLKISNVVFFRDPPDVARCLIDLDTLGHQLMPLELGDALRSWCNPLGENHDQPRVDVEIFTAAIQGYVGGAPRLLSEAEATSLVAGLQTICVELAARFCIDVFEDRYFGFDASRFATRRDHNLVRGRSQLGLGRDVQRRRAELEGIVAKLFARSS